MSLSKEFAEMVKEQNEQCRFVHPLICGAEFSPLKEKSRWLSEYRQLMQFAKKNHWEQVPNLVEHLHNPDTAIVITSAGEKIEWVNSGFFRMTGYESKEAIGRNPAFLQGKQTRQDDIQQLRHSLRERKPFSAVVLNYRKSGETYHCKIDVFPMFDYSQKLVNFLAVENEVSMPA